MEIFDELTMPNRASRGQRQYCFAVWGNLGFKFLDRDIDFNVRNLILHFCIPTTFWVGRP